MIYHLLTRTECKHVERGMKEIRTKAGLKRLVRRNGIRLVECGYVDMPLIPDIGFSIKELRNFLGQEIDTETTPRPPKEILSKIKKIAFIEEKGVPYLIKTFLAHHIYVLGKVK